MATIHPAAVARDLLMFPIVCNDLMKGLTQPPEFYSPYPSLQEVQEFKYTTFAFDIETPKYRELGDKAPVEMVGLTGKKFECIVVPVRGAYVQELKRIFAGASNIIGHNSLAFDLPKLQETLAIRVGDDCKHWDTMLLHHLLFPDLPHDLEFVGTQLTDKGNWKADKASMQIYNARDTDVTFQVWQTLMPMLKKENLVELYELTQVPLARICKLMTDTGVKIDKTRLAEVRKELLLDVKREEDNLPERLRTYDKAIHKRQPAPEGTLGKSGKPVKFILVDATEEVIPWRSTSVKAAYFYGPVDKGGLGQPEVLDPKKKTVTTGKLAITKITTRLRKLEDYATAKIVQSIGNLNKIDEMITTFAKEDIADEIHPGFLVHGTSSGRLSASDPPCQNIPEKARILYIPPHPKWVHISADFSNIENRLTARLADDIERLAKYDDPAYSDYKVLVSRAFGIPYDQVVKDNSREAPYGKAKAIVLGTNYGLGKKKIADMYDIDPKEVELLMSTWRREIKHTIIWQENIGRIIADEGVLTNPFGRKRWLYSNAAYTEGLSFLPQSAAADVIFRCMVGLLYERIGWPEEKVAQIVGRYKALPRPAKLVMQVHDSLEFHSPPDLVDEVINTVRYVLEQPWPQMKNIIIPTSIAVGPNWGELEMYKH